MIARICVIVSSFLFVTSIFTQNNKQAQQLTLILLIRLYLKKTQHTQVNKSYLLYLLDGHVKRWLWMGVNFLCHSIILG